MKKKIKITTLFASISLTVICLFLLASIFIFNSVAISMSSKGPFPQLQISVINTNQLKQDYKQASTYLPHVNATTIVNQTDHNIYLSDGIPKNYIDAVSLSVSNRHYLSYKKDTIYIKEVPDFFDYYYINNTVFTSEQPTNDTSYGYLTPIGEPTKSTKHTLKAGDSYEI